jgi:hypothetical protein
MDIPFSTLSLIAFIFTVGVGYIILLWAYSSVNRIREWYELNVFDKTMQTFFVGGIASFVSLMIMKAPLLQMISNTTMSSTVWMDWLAKNLGGLIISESVVIVVTLMLINEYLVKPFSEISNYSV